MSEAPRWPNIHITEITEIDGRKVESVLTSPVCDLCGDIGPAWEYDCQDFEIEEIDFGSLGAWAACNPCSELIEADDYEGLLERSLCNPLYPGSWRERIKRIHQEFRANRIGERQPWG